MTDFYEEFVTEDENTSTVKNVFAIVGYVAMGIVLTLLFVWTYYASNSNQYLFITLLGIIILIYCVIVISVTVVNKNCFDATSYNILFGITIFMLFMSFVLSLIFVLKYFNVFSTLSNSRNSSLSSSNRIDTYQSY